MRMLLGGVVLASACYRPSADPECSLTCEQGNPTGCPSGLACGADSLCRRANAVDCTDRVADAGLDSAQDTDSEVYPFCFGHLVQVCLPAPPSMPRVFANEALDTSPISMRCDDALPASVCVVAATSLSVAAGTTLRVTGTRPLVIVVTSSTFTIDGLIDAASHVSDFAQGPGANPAASCPVANTAGLTDMATSFGGGGAGGSFAGRGGVGGQSNAQSASGGGTPTSPDLNSGQTLRGGCSGGASGKGTTLAQLGGAGGGALYLIGGDLTLNGAIDVSGAGANSNAAGGAKAGGGGGGAGGMLAIEASSITINGTIFADGGGGGGGGAAAGGGQSGGDPIGAAGGAMGGDGVMDASAGMAGGGGNGDLGAPNQLDGAAGQDGGVDLAGGGGGGGAGVITFHSMDITNGGTVRPAFETF